MLLSSLLSHKKSKEMPAGNERSCGERSLHVNSRWCDVLGAKIGTLLVGSCLFEPAHSEKVLHAGSVLYM